MHWSKFENSARLQRMQSVLKGGRKMTTYEIAAALAELGHPDMNVSTTIAELRMNGAVIETSHERHTEERRTVYSYRMTRPVNDQGELPLEGAA